MSSAQKNVACHARRHLLTKHVCRTCFAWNHIMCLPRHQLETCKACPARPWESCRLYLYCDDRRDIRWNIAWARGKSRGQSPRDFPRDFPRAQAIFHCISWLESQYRHSKLQLLVLRGFWSAFGLEMYGNKTTKCQKNLSFLVGTFSTGCHRVTDAQNSNLTKSQLTVRRQRNYQEIRSVKK